MSDLEKRKKAEIERVTNNMVATLKGAPADSLEGKIDKGLGKIQDGINSVTSKIPGGLFGGGKNKDPFGPENLEQIRTDLALVGKPVPDVDDKGAPLSFEAKKTAVIAAVQEWAKTGAPGKTKGDDWLKALDKAADEKRKPFQQKTWGAEALQTLGDNLQKLGLMEKNDDPMQTLERFKLGKGLSDVKNDKIVQEMIKGNADLAKSLPIIEADEKEKARLAEEERKRQEQQKKPAPTQQKTPTPTKKPAPKKKGGPSDFDQLLNPDDFADVLVSDRQPTNSHVMASLAELGVTGGINTDNTQQTALPNKSGGKQIGG